ncbi:hypothetical protein [uncultured Mediterranean phage uvDeep-CGR2-KM21-C338]|nr:hypothetical protein [uncultured Mediterranean phage uvDeep-CGR2-KM21-C338]
MAITLTLTDGTTTHDLAGSTYMVRTETLDLGVPEVLRAEHGNIFMSSWGITGHAKGKRTISADVLVTASTLALLTSALRDIQNAIERARAYALSGVGNQWQLQYSPGDGSTYAIDIQDGTFTVGAGDRSAVRLVSSNPRLVHCSLSLDVDPYWQGTEETIENYVLDPSYEVAGTALADWTESKTATGTTARDTTQAKYGNASCKLVMTNSGGSGQVIERNQSLADVDAAETWSFGCWVYVTALSNCKFVLDIEYTGGSSTATVEVTSTNSAFTLVKIEGQTVPSSTTAAVFKPHLEATASSATGTCYVDACIAVQAATVPTAWVSSRTIANHFDDAAQAHTNYVDIYGVPGDVLGRLQVQATEGEVHTEVWAGARHDARLADADIWIEGEDFATWDSEPSDAAASGGNYGKRLARPAFDAVSTGSTSSATTVTISHATGTDLQRLMLVGIVQDSSDEDPSAIAYDGVTLTKLEEQAATGGSPNIQVWYLVAPSTGTNNLVLTWASSLNRSVHVLTFENVHQTTPLGTAAKAQATSVTPSVAVVGVAEDLIFDCVGSDSTTTMTPGTDQTERSDVTAGDRGSTSTERATGTSTTMSHTAANDAWGIIGVAIKGDIGTAAAPVVVTKSVTTPPRGTYRVLARVRNPDGAAWGVAMGFAYGGITNDPSVAADYSSIGTGTTIWHWLDIGTLIVPPQILPDGATLGTLTLRLAFYRSSGTGDDGFQCDSVMLLPVDFGSAYTSKTSSADRVVLDGISPAPSLSLWDSSDVFQSRPQQEGTPPLVDPNGTRIYFVFDDAVDATITDGATVAIRYIPLFEQVG